MLTRLFSKRQKLDFCIKITLNACFKGCDHAEAVSCRTVTTEGRVRYCFSANFLFSWNANFRFLFLSLGKQPLVLLDKYTYPHPPPVEQNSLHHLRD